MSNFTDFGEALLADFLRGEELSLPEGFRVALLEAVGDDGTYTEASWTGYQRQLIERSLTAWSGTQAAGTTLPSTGTSHATSNNVAVDFGAVGAGGSAAITHVGLFLDDGNDDLLCYAPLPTTMNVSDGDPVSFGPGSIVFTLGITGGMSDYLANRLVDLIFRGESYAMPAAMYASLYTAAPTNAGGGAEVAGGGYARVSIPTTAAQWARTGGRIDNVNNIVFPNPSGDWGTVTHTGLHDAAVAGNLLFWAPLEAAKTVNTGSPTPRFEPGARSIEIQ